MRRFAFYLSVLLFTVVGLGTQPVESAGCWCKPMGTGNCAIDPPGTLCGGGWFNFGGICEGNVCAGGVCAVGGQIEPECGPMPR